MKTAASRLLTAKRAKQAAYHEEGCQQAAYHEECHQKATCHEEGCQQATYFNRSISICTSTGVLRGLGVGPAAYLH